MRFFISAGEHSGDMHGASLVRAIRAMDADAEFVGMGGPLMAAEGVQILHDPTTQSTIGFVEVIKNYRRFKRLLDVFETFWQKNRPDIMLWVDFGGFNLALAERAKKHGIPVLCLFSPSAWAYGQERAVRMGRCVDRLASVLPFETDFYSDFGVNAEYVGHPLIDRVLSGTSREAFREQLGIDHQTQLVALLPGSRRQELQRLLPVMLEAAETIVQQLPRVQFVLPIAPSLQMGEVEEILQSASRLPIQRLSGRAYDVMNGADLGLIASGTATLEAAILELPMIVTYRVSPISAAIYRLLAERKVRREGIRIGLPNLIAGHQIVPEVIQEQCNGENIADIAVDLLRSESKLHAMREALTNVRETIGPPGVMPRVAQMALELVKDTQEKPL